MEILFVVFPLELENSLKENKRRLGLIASPSDPKLNTFLDLVKRDRGSLLKVHSDRKSMKGKYDGLCSSITSLSITIENLGMIMGKAKTKKRTEKELKIEAIDLWLRIGVEVLRDLPEVYEEVEQHLNKKIEEITLSDLEGI